jgi:IS30 family transposase
VSGKTEGEVTAAIIERLKDVAGCVKTLTFDNGLEFSGHEKIAAATGAKVFFARPYHSWERGLNEQTNGLVRQYFAKGSCFQHLTQADMHPVEEKLNNRPRKVLDYRTPQEVSDNSYTKRAVALRVGIRGYPSTHR